MVQYYTLEEAAAKLRITPEQLKEMVKKNEVRAFKDRGNFRFRAQEILELARSRGMDSDPEFPLGESSGPKSGMLRSSSKLDTSGPKSGLRSSSKLDTSGPKSGLHSSSKLDASGPKSGLHSSSKLAGPKSSAPKSSTLGSAGPKSSVSKLSKPAAPTPPSPPVDDDFMIDLGAEDNEVPIGLEPSPSPSKSKARKTQTPGAQPRPSALGGPSPSPLPAAGDSDVRLIGEGGTLDFHIEEVRAEQSRAPASKPPGSSRRSKVEPAVDSGVRIVPLDDAPDSDVKILPARGDSQVALGRPQPKSPSDSDIRLEGIDDLDSGPPKSTPQNLVTEEIDLDAEEQAAAQRETARPKPRPASPPRPVAPAPFELSDPDVDIAPKSTSKLAPKSTPKIVPGKAEKSLTDSSSDFELTPLRDLDSSPLDVGTDEQTPIHLAGEEEEEVGLGELTGPAGEPGSGIKLNAPADSGISLEHDEDSDDLELSLDAGATPKPGRRDDSSGEFELALDDDAGMAEEGTSSEFDLSLDVDSSEEVVAEPESDSEFELTIDDGNAAVEEEPELAEDKDIFETDFDVPALEDESGSEAVALEDDEAALDSEDFDLAIDEEDSTEAESGSEVMPLDEDEVEAEDEPVARPKGRAGRAGRTAVVEEDEEPAPFDDLDTDEAAAEEAEEEAVAAAPARTKEWGILPVRLMTPCAIIMALVCLMSYEMLSSQWGYHKSTKTSSLIVDPLARAILGEEGFPKD